MTRITGGPAVAALLLLALASCERQEAAGPAPAAASPPAEALGADPVVAEADNEKITASMVEDRVRGVEASLQGPRRTVEALLRAVSDALIIREMAVMDHHPKPGERPSETTDRFLAGVYRADDACRSITDADLKLEYMASLGRYKHPSSFTVWEAQLVCCVSPDRCPPGPASACKRRLHPKALALAREIRAGLPASTGLPAAVTVVAMDDSPLPGTHGPVFERAVAALAEQVSETRLRRYTFFGQGEPGFEGARVRGTSPEVEAAARAARLGELVGPIETGWGWSVMLLVAREPAVHRELGDRGVRDELRERACEERAGEARDAYRQRLIRGARLLWRRPAIARVFGKRVLPALPPDATSRERPHMPHM